MEYYKDIETYCHNNAEHLEAVSLNKILNYITHDDSAKVEELKSDKDKKQEIERIASDVISDLMQKKKTSPAAKTKTAAVSPKAKTAATSPKVAKAATKVGGKKTAVKKSSTASTTLPKLIQLYKLKRLYREIPRSHPDYDVAMKDRVIDELLKLEIISKRALPSLKEAKKWREKEDIAEELRSIQRDL